MLAVAEVVLDIQAVTVLVEQVVLAVAVQVRELVLALQAQPT
jgi:hypothetical protein